MKNKGIKIVLIILLIIIAISLINVMIFAIIHKDKNDKISFLAFGNKTEMLFQNEYNQNEINNISINATSSNVKFQEGNSDKVKVTVYGHKNQDVTVKLEENELEIKKENNVFQLFAFFCWFRDEIIIEIPKDYNGDIQIKTSSGKIELLDLEQANMQIESTSGNIECGNMSNGNLKTTSGNIRMGNSNEVTLKATSGNIMAEEIRNKGTIQTSSGKIEVKEIKQGEIESTSGKVKIEKANRITATTTSGSIHINQIDGYCNLSSNSGGVKIENLQINENSTIHTTSGNVNISKGENMYIETKTMSGNVKVENNNRKAEIELKIETASGSIKVNND